MSKGIPSPHTRQRRRDSIPATPMPRTSYTTQEEAALRQAWKAGVQPDCPRCDRTLSARPVPRPGAVSYVRYRSWLSCPSCGRAVVADDPLDARGRG